MSEGLSRHARAFARSTRERGLLATLHIAISTLWWTLLDNIDERVYRTATSEDVPIYSTPSQYRIIKKALKAVRKLSGRGFSESTLVDFGCGKGRVLMVGSEFGFKKVVGVEVSPDLCREAEANIGAYIARRRKPFEFQIVNADVTCFEIPPDADVLYFFGWFDGDVLDQVARNIVRSRERFPRAIWAIYVKATYGEVFGNHGFRTVGHLTWCGLPTRIYAL